MKKRNLIIFLMILIILGFSLLIFKKNNKENYEEIGLKKYNEVYNLYLRVGMKFEEEYIEEYQGYAAKYFAVNNIGNLYKINNFDELTSNIFTTKGLEEYKKFNEIIEDQNDYFISSDLKFRNIDYSGTNLKIKKEKSKSILYEATSTFCSKDKCSENEYILVKNEFKIVKQNDEWVVDKFIFPEKEVDLDE